MKKIISFWKNQSKNGNIYYSGKLGELDLIGFENNQKKNPKEPDIIFYLKEDKPTTKYEKKNNKITQDDLREDDPFQEYNEQVEIDDSMLED